MVCVLGCSNAARRHGDLRATVVSSLVAFPEGLTPTLSVTLALRIYTRTLNVTPIRVRPTFTHRRETAQNRRLEDTENCLDLLGYEIVRNDF